MIILFVFKVQFKMNLNLPGYVNCYEIATRQRAAAQPVEFYYELTPAN